MIDNLYLPSGYINMGAVLADPHPFIILVGARGTGKTFGAMDQAAAQDIRFLYFRRTAKIVELITDPAMHVFKPINSLEGWNIQPEGSKGLVRFIDRDSEAVKGYAAGLSTFANVRGFDSSDVKLIIYDEFIPEPTERIMFNAWTALLNAIETVGRNRELSGAEPVKVLLLSNSDLIYSDIIAGLGIGDKLLMMQETGTEQMDVSPELLLIRPASSAFKDAKSRTALYRLTAGSDFAGVALDNRFPIEDRSRIKKEPLKEYIPLAAISGICIYQHKTLDRFYVSARITGSPTVYDTTAADLKRFYRERSGVWRAHQRRRVYFEGVDVQTKFKNLFE